ncbi:inorganic diphosphatase [Bradyrhizobium sp. MOS001]|uniref:inorganic diphosphatase n=1 Tax=Bradyrhizobium sp. MOS001 TaxID=2133948 RepID=UPI001FCE85FC|nr:inorganic diphosphatase [Bradyrhizobium sp. MOS001]
MRRRADLSGRRAALSSGRHSRSRTKEQGQEGTKHRVFAVPDRSPLETDLKDIRNLPSHARDDLEQFFRATNALENKELKFLGWHGPNRAAKTIKRLAR